MDYKENDFEEVYKNLIDVYRIKLEEYRQLAIDERENNKKTIGKIIFAGIVVDLIILYLMFSVHKNIEILAIIFMGVIFLVGVYTTKADQTKKKKEEYRTLFKKDIINYLMSMFSDNFNYEPDGRIEDYTYIAANFEKSKLVVSSDTITGTINGTRKFKIAEVSTYYEYKYNCFNGLFTMINIGQQLNTEIFIRKTKDSSFEKLYEKTKIEMDSSEFEKIFNVYTSNKISAMQLLTADIMTMLVDLYNSIKRDFDITIKDSYIYLRVEGINMFEVLNLDGESLEKENIYKNYYLILDFVFKLSDKLSKLIDETPL